MPFWDRKRIKNCLGCQGLSGSTQIVPIVLKICSRVLEASLLRIMERFLASDHFFVSYSLGLGSEICVWDRKYVEKIISRISSYLIQNYLCMCPDQCEWIWDRLFSLFICEKSFWDRKIPFLGSKKRNSPKPHNYQNLKLKTTFRKTTPYCTK